MAFLGSTDPAAVLRHLAAEHPRSRLSLTDLALPKNRVWFWAHCETCARHMEDMKVHLRDHQTGRVDVRGVRQDLEGRAATRKRLLSRYGRVRRG